MERSRAVNDNGKLTSEVSFARSAGSLVTKLTLSARNKSLSTTPTGEGPPYMVSGSLPSEPTTRASEHDKLGLVLLCQSFPASDGQKNFPIDIVFVHGLNGNMKGT